MPAPKARIGSGWASDPGVTRRDPRAPRLRRIELRDCGVRRGRRWVLRDVSIEIAAGERWLLLGPNGAGKTSLLGMLRGDLWPTPTGREARRYEFADGTRDPSPAAAAGRVALLGAERQDRYVRFESTLTVAQVVLTGFDDSEFPLQPATAAQRRRIAAVLREVGLSGVASRPMLTLSYGQRRRALLARALVRRPDVLLLDEALNGLDATGRRTFLRALRRATGPRTAWMLGTHRREDLDLAPVTHVARMVAGRLEAAGPVPAAGGGPGHGRTSARMALHAPGRDDRGVRARRAIDGTARAALFEVERAAICREGRPVLAAFDWSLRPGEHWHLRGANGSGKSTLMATIYGDLWPRHGAIVRRLRPAVEDWKRLVGYVAPELQARFSATGCTVAEIVASGLQDSVGLNVLPTAAERRRVARELRAWRIDGLAQRRARQLSYGQLRLVLAARAFVRPRRLYLLDEPFDGLDAEARGRLRARIVAAVRGGATLVIASHHEEDVPDCVEWVLTLRRGRAPVASRRGAEVPTAATSPRRR